MFRSALKTGITLGLISLFTVLVTHANPNANIIAIVDMQQIIENNPGYTEINERLKNEHKKLQAKYTEKYNNLKAKQNILQKENAGAAEADLEKEVERETTKIRQEYYNELLAFRKKIIRLIVQKMQEDRNIAIVIDKAAVLAVSKNVIDLTNPVLAELNKPGKL